MFNKIKIKNMVVDNPANVCIEFNRYFQSVFTRRANAATFVLPSIYNAPVMSEISVSVQGFFARLLNLDNKKSSGPDEIPAGFMNKYSE